MNHAISADSTTILLGRAVLSPDGPLFDHGVVMSGGVIERIAPNTDLLVLSGRVLDCRDQLILPGFVNGHTHMYGVLSHGIPSSAAVTDFNSFLRAYWWPYVEDRIDHDLAALTAEWACANMTASGVTCFVDILEAPFAVPGGLERIAGVVRHSGLRGYLSIEASEREKTGIRTLKVGFNRVFGYYIEVSKSFIDQVPEGYIRKQTLANCERYITQELKEYEEKILSAEDRIYALETRIYGELVAEIQRNIPAIQTNCRIIARLDVLAGFAQLARDNHYNRPEMTKDLALDIKAGRHPVIETLMPAGEEYVPNDIFLDNKKQQIIILTGPNMAGKSALLRQTALIVLLAQIGSFVPAESARIGYFDKIFTRVGATDNISRGESTFMVEMLETSMILHNLSERSLVLLDEIGRGTSTYDGMSIARAIVEYIHEYGRGAKTLFATHYHELNDLEEIYSRVRNFHIAVKEVGSQVIFLRKLKEGGTAHSFGIHVARMAGMPKEVIQSAENTLKALEMNDSQHLVSARKGEIKKPVQTKAGTLESDGSLQLSFFQLDDPTLESLRDKLAAADLNNITPLQAFDLLRSMKDELGI